PIRESSSGARYSGKMVRTSMRTAGSALRPGGAGGLRLGALLVLRQRVEQPAGRVGDHDAGLEVDLGHELLDQRQLHASPVGGAHDQEVLRRVVVHARDDAELAPVDVADGEALELRGIPGVGILGGLLLGVDRELEVHPAQGLGVGAVRDLLEARVPALLLEAGAGHGEGAGAAGDLGLEHGAGAQALLGLVGAQDEGDLAAQAVRAADRRDDHVEGAHAVAPFEGAGRSAKWAGRPSAGPEATSGTGASSVAGASSGAGAPTTASPP